MSGELFFRRIEIVLFVALWIEQAYKIRPRRNKTKLIRI
jgi:hypothetical protein